MKNQCLIIVLLLLFGTKLFGQLSTNELPLSFSIDKIELFVNNRKPVKLLLINNNQLLTKKPQIFGAFLLIKIAKL